MRGINIPGVLVPGIVDGYILEGTAIKGSFAVVPTEEDLNRLPEGILVQGSTVFVSDTKKQYRWIDNNWEECYNNFIIDAPADDKYYIRYNSQWVALTKDQLISILNTEEPLILNGNN